MQPRKGPTGCDDATASTTPAQPLHSTREVVGDRSSPGRTHNTDVIGLRRHCRRLGQLRVPTRHGMPGVYENNISFYVAMIDIYSSGRPGIWHCEKSPRYSLIVLCQKPPASEMTRDWPIFTPRHGAGWRILTIAKAVDPFSCLPGKNRGMIASKLDHAWIDFSVGGN